MKIVLGADPWGVPLKDAVETHLLKLGHEVVDVGSKAGSDVAYYDVAPTAAKLVGAGEADRAILFCGTGMGMAIVANKFPRIVASCVESPFAAKMCRAVNGANVLSMGSMIVAETQAIIAVDEFLTTELADTLEQFTDFLKGAVCRVAEIDAECRNQKG